MKKGDFVYIDYIGKVKGTGEVFDLTNEALAKREGIYNPNAKYKPIPIIIGAEFVVKGLDEALQEMSVGEKRTVEVEPGKAFGDRKPELIRLLPLSAFKEQDIDPNSGSYVTINGLNGRVVSNSGGRIRVDFNHPLAGKKLEYEVEVKEEIKDAPKKVLAIANFYTGIDGEGIEANVEGEVADVKLKSDMDVPNRIKEKIAEIATKWIEIKKIRFVSEYEKK